MLHCLSTAGAFVVTQHYFPILLYVALCKDFDSMKRGMCSEYNETPNQPLESTILPTVAWPTQAQPLCMPLFAGSRHLSSISEFHRSNIVQHQAPANTSFSIPAVAHQPAQPCKHPAAENETLCLFNPFLRRFFTFFARFNDFLCS